MNIEPQDPRDPKTFRRVLGRFPTGVAVITAAQDNRKVGMVVGSFTSISLDPPLVGFLPGKSSQSWAQIEQTGRFCVNVLGSDQTEICQTFASKVEDKYEGLAVSHSPLGLPILPGAVAWIDCTINQVCELGDHYLVVGAVESMGVGSSQSPLIFAQGAYHSLANPNPG